MILITIGALPLSVAVHKSRKSISEKQHLAAWLEGRETRVWQQQQQQQHQQQQKTE